MPILIILKGNTVEAGTRGVCSLANSNVANEETQSNPVSGFVTVCVISYLNEYISDEASTYQQKGNLLLKIKYIYQLNRGRLMGKDYL